MNELITLFLPPVANILMLALLVYYRINKRFKKEQKDGFWAFLDHNLVELIFGAVLVPDLWGQIAKLIP